MQRVIIGWVASALAAVLTWAGSSYAQSESDLAKQSQNPVGDLISVPLQNNFNFGVGPGAVLLGMPGNWVMGTVFYNVWSFAGEDARGDVNFLFWQYFINYNFPSGTYLTTSPVNTANWEADKDNRWTIPLGAGVGKVFSVGSVPLNCSAHAYRNVESPEDGADWQMRIQVQLLFPK